MLHFRALPALIVAAAVLVTALLLASLPAQAQADLLCTQTKMNIVAHQDDDLIFQSPDLLEAIAAGECVRTVFVTAGDAGLGEAYWREREEGSRAAYAVMAGVPNSWTKSEATVAGHVLHIATLTGKPTVSQVYLRLPNGGPSGSGYAATGFKSLPKLWRSHNPEPASLSPISELTALDGSATYTYEGLLATLQALIAEFEPEVISTQNFTVEFGTGDHADHITTAKLTRIAANSWTGEHVLRSYMDYETKNSPINVFEPQLAKKLSAYYAYAAHDSNEACASQLKCEELFFTDYWAWLKRQMVASETSVPGANAGPDQAVASKAAVTLDGSGSSDPLGHSLGYEWKQTAGSAVTLSNSKAVKPTFTAPTGPASLTFSLVVKSAEASSRADSVTVSVAAPKFALKVTRSGNGTGTVASSPAGIECGSDCEEAYEQGTEVTLTASAATGSEFKGWSGACAGTGSCKVTVSAAKSVGAEFVLVKHHLTVTKAGSGSGTVASSPAGIECGATCAANFDHGTLVKLTGTPAAGSKAVAWSGCDAVNASNQCEVTMSAAKSVTATFTLESHLLTVAKNGSGSGTVTSSPAGISCGSECSASFPHGTVVKLTGTPSANTKAVVWESCPGTVNASNQCEVTMSAAKEAKATFNLEQRQLTVEGKGTGSGSIASSPAGINCGSECAATFNYGTLVKLTGTPAAGSKAVAWSGCDAVNASNQCEVTMSAAKAVTATFTLEQHQLSVSKSGTGTGTVTSLPAGIECGVTCAANFDHGTEVTLTASPAAGSEFKGWSGACTGTGSCKVAMSAAKSVGAEFALEKHQLSVSKSGSGSGSVTSSPAGIECGVTCAANFNHGTLVKLTGAPGPNSKAVIWESCPGTVNASNQCEVTMSAAKEAVATFGLEQRQLTVERKGNGSGTIASSPAGLECGAICSASYDHGTLVKLTGTPTGGSEAAVWSGCDAVNASNQCEVTMSAAKKVEATFTLESHQLSVSKSGTGTGTVTSSPAGIECGAICAASFDHGTVVKLNGTPTEGSKAVVWQTCPGTVNASNQCEVTVDAVKSAKARFDLEGHLLRVERNGNGTGAVTSSPASIDCGTECSASFLHGTLVKLTGTPADGSKPVAWSGCDVVNGVNECEVTMTTAKSVTASFELESHQLGVAVGGAGSGVVTSSPAGIECGSSCATSFDHGTLVKLTGAPGPNSKAVTWESCPGIVNASNQCEVMMSAAKEAKARFDLESHPLSVEVKGAGSGTVTSSPAGIECEASCVASFQHGTEVTLAASPAAGFKSAVWSGCDAIVGTNECEVTMTEAKAVTAEFDPIGTFSLKVKKVGPGAGTVISSPAGIECGPTCEAIFSEGAKVKLASSSAVGSKAVEWSGCDAVVDGECEVTMGAAKEVTATYTLETRSLKIVKIGTGQGVVTSSPAGIECGSSCEATFDYGTEVTLTATSDPGIEPVVWSGCDEVLGGDECRVSMEADGAVSATLNPVPDPPVPTPTPTPTPEPPPTMPSVKLLKAKVEHQHGTVRFVFAARGSATGFRCALSKIHQELKYKRCSSPTTYRNLQPGRYVFKVRAVAPGGADTTPATRRFEVR